MVATTASMNLIANKRAQYARSPIPTDYKIYAAIRAFVLVRDPLVLR